MSALTHPAPAATLRSAAETMQLAALGVDDPLWLHAVRHHHNAPPGPIAGLFASNHRLGLGGLLFDLAARGLLKRLNRGR